MTEKRKSWGHSATTPIHLVTAPAKAASGIWSIDRLSPKSSSSTNSVKASYSGMTVVRRNGKK